MKIFVDADACPVVDIVEKIAGSHHIPVTLLCDTNHVLRSDYSDVIVVGAGADAVDYKLISLCKRDDYRGDAGLRCSRDGTWKGCGGDPSVRKVVHQ